MDHILYPFVGHDPVKGIGNCIKYLRGRLEAEQKVSVHIVSPVPMYHCYVKVDVVCMLLLCPYYRFGKHISKNKPSPIMDRTLTSQDNCLK